MAAKANPKPASGTMAANARGPAVRKTAPLMTEAPAIATARAELSRPCVRPRKAGGAIRARAAIVPRWVAPNDRPCRICRAKVAGRPGSNVITAKRKIAAAPPSLRQRKAPRATSIMGPSSANSTISATTPAAHKKPIAVSEKPRAPIDAGEAIERGMTRLNERGGGQDAPEGRRHRFQVRRFGGALRNVNRF